MPYGVPPDTSPESDESCDRCRHSRGPVVLTCVNERSEFFQGLVRADGYCPCFEREHSTTELARRAGDD